MATMQEIKDKAKARRAEMLKEFNESGEPNFRKFALKQRENGSTLTTVRYWQMLSKAKKEADENCTAEN